MERNFPGLLTKPSGPQKIGKKCQRYCQNSRLSELQKDGKTEAQALQRLIRKIQDLIPATALRDNDDKMKGKYLINAFGATNRSSFYQFNLDALYDFMELGKNIHKWIRL